IAQRAPVMCEMTACFLEGGAWRRCDLQLRLQHFCHHAVAKALLGEQKEFLVDTAHRMARLRVKQKVFLFHAKRVHAALQPPRGNFVPPIVDAKWLPQKPAAADCMLKNKSVASESRKA